MWRAEVRELPHAVKPTKISETDSGLSPVVSSDPTAFDNYCSGSAFSYYRMQSQRSNTVLVLSAAIQPFFYRP
jgi:hypothetical protein